MTIEVKCYLRSLGKTIYITVIELSAQRFELDLKVKFDLRNKKLLINEVGHWTVKRTLIYHLGKHRVIYIENQLLLNIKLNRDDWWLLFYDSY